MDAARAQGPEETSGAETGGPGSVAVPGRANPCTAHLLCDRLCALGTGREESQQVWEAAWTCR